MADRKLIVLLTIHLFSQNNFLVCCISVTILEKNWRFHLSIYQQNTGGISTMVSWKIQTFFSSIILAVSESLIFPVEIYRSEQRWMKLNICGLTRKDFKIWCKQKHVKVLNCLKSGRLELRSQVFTKSNSGCFRWWWYWLVHGLWHSQSYHVQVRIRSPFTTKRCK